MDKHPAAAADLQEFGRFVEHADGELDKAYELDSRHLDVMREAAEKEGYDFGQSKDMADALDEAYADGSLGGHSKPYVRKRTSRDSALDDAKGELMQDLSTRTQRSRQAGPRPHQGDPPQRLTPGSRPARAFGPRVRGASAAARLAA